MVLKFDSASDFYMYKEMWW